MKNTFVIFLAACIFYSCKKTSSGGVGNTPPTLKSITVYFPALHISDVQTFTFNGTQLTEYSVHSIDTAGAEIDQETRTYGFQYSMSSTLPSSSSFQVVDRQGVNIQNGGGMPENFIYDKNNRLIEDSSLPDGGQSVYNYYSYLGDSISFTDSETVSGSFPAGGLRIANGNIAVSSGMPISYGSVPNPLYDPAIGNTFGAYFYLGLIGYTQPNFSIPADFISRNLPTTWTGSSSAFTTTFTWTTGSDGKVTAGTAVNLFPGTVGYNQVAQITFTYQ